MWTYHKTTQMQQHIYPAMSFIFVRWHTNRNQNIAELNWALHYKIQWIDMRLNSSKKSLLECPDFKKYQHTVEKTTF